MADDAYDGDGDFEGGDIADIAEEMDELEDVEATDETGKAIGVAKESRALQFLMTHHPECRLDYIEQVQDKLPLRAYPPDNGADMQHKSVPYLTPFEKAKVIGFRANQLAQGARPFVERPPYMTDVLEIARLELEQRKLPFILKRPFPNGEYEYVRLADLLIL
jgi:DNA-directed RNA polymerase subunit K/omega